MAEPTRRAEKTDELQPSRGSFFLQSRWWMAASVIFAFTFTFFIFTPLDIFLGNSIYFVFRLHEFLGLQLLYALLPIACFALIAFLLRRHGKMFDLFVTLLFSFLLCGYIQGNFLNTGLGVMDGGNAPWLGNGRQVMLNAAIWAAVVVVPFLLYFFARKGWNIVVRYLSMLIVLMQLVALVGSLASAEVPLITDAYFSNEDMFRLSEDENVIVFVVDACDNTYIDLVEYTHPGFFEPLKGFTRYQDVTSGYDKTFPSLSYMATGVPYDPTIHFYDYFRKAYQESAFLQDLRENGYSIQLLSATRTLSGDASIAEDFVDNVKRGTRQVDGVQIAAGYLRLSGYRNMPFAFKQPFGLFTDFFNSQVQNGHGMAYQLDDAQFFEKLQENGLAADASQKQFIFYHLEGSHAPFTLDENGMRVGASDVVQQTKGVFNIIYEYIRQMKELGIFDYSTIIITADHGIQENCPPTPAFYIKMSGETDGNPLRASAAPLAHMDLQPTIIDAVGGDTSAYEGLPAYAVTEDDFRVRHTMIMGRSYWLDAIDGFAGDWDRWYLVDEGEILYPFHKQ